MNAYCLPCSKRKRQNYKQRHMERYGQRQRKSYWGRHRKRVNSNEFMNTPLAPAFSVLKRSTGLSKQEGKACSSGPHSSTPRAKRGRPQEVPSKEVIIEVCELRRLASSAWVFGLVYTVQKAPSKTGEMGWYSFNNQKGFMTVIEKKPKIKNQKYDFLFIHRVASWADVLDWKDGKPVRNPFEEVRAMLSPLKKERYRGGDCLSVSALTPQRRKIPQPEPMETEVSGESIRREGPDHGASQEASPLLGSGAGDRLEQANTLRGPPGSVQGLLVPTKFHRERFFKAWVHYVEDRRRVVQAAEDMNEVVFPCDLSNDDDPNHPRSTAPLDGDSEGGSDDDLDV
ncbi:hypothetical protein Cgig2_001043 [Carnegiea gigantea]|uniref:Uncharacterized protein n=1 Tax=Carnegiea gigantea TaxID=171969 RepID=A0A9Q1GXQ2_9CARY|nr:hypothetical protein Cgig2_001043 [Carnegiea gigantea]